MHKKTKQNLKKKTQELHKLIIFFFTQMSLNYCMKSKLSSLIKKTFSFHSQWHHHDVPPLCHSLTLLLLCKNSEFFTRKLKKSRFHVLIIFFEKFFPLLHEKFITWEIHRRRRFVRPWIEHEGGSEAINFYESYSHMRKIQRLLSFV